MALRRDLASTSLGRPDIAVLVLAYRKGWNVRRFRVKPGKRFVDVPAASPSSWKTPLMATFMVW